MQISGVIPILLNIILSEQHNQKQGQIPRELIAAKETAKAAEILAKGTEREAPSQPHARGQEGSEPLLLPLPLKTPLYPETQFYIYRKRGEQKKEQNKAAEEPGVVFSLSTHSMGSLFFYLTIKEATINIACHTENEKFATQLAAHSSELKEQVQKAGFTQVLFRCTVLDPQMKHLMTGLTNPVMLDQKVWDGVRFMSQIKPNLKKPLSSKDYAAALRYDPNQEEAPRVTAAGRGELAQVIRKLADEHDIPVYVDATLAETLYKLGVDTQIPPELYEAVAQILVFVAKIDNRFP